jgi:beta-lactamase regulating signal transducer with metallopeptidase domain
MTDTYYLLTRGRRSSKSFYKNRTAYAARDEATRHAIKAYANKEEAKVYQLYAQASDENPVVIASWKKTELIGPVSWDDSWSEDTQEYHCVHELRDGSIDDLVTSIIDHPPVEDAKLESVVLADAVLQALAPK